MTCKWLVLAAVLLSALPASAAPDAALRTGLDRVAALPGEPAMVSAAGITRQDTDLLTLENRSAFDASPKRRLVLVGGLDGDDESARAVLDAVRWLKTTAPPAVRRKWIVSALPLANADRQPRPMVFPPEKGFFDDPDQPETRYVWRWTIFQAPDAVVVVTKEQSNAADTLVAALRLGRWSGFGAVPATAAGSARLRDTLLLLLESPAAAKASPLHQAILARADRKPLDVAKALAPKYPQQAIASYIPSVAWMSLLRLSDATGDDQWRAKVREQTAPWISGAKPVFGEKTPLTSIAGSMIFAELARRDRDDAAQRLADNAAKLAAETKEEGGEYAHGSGWTDDMFMATSVLARTGQLELASKMLRAYAGRLQRPDGVFVHGPKAPHPWGRGNGFAALGLMEALTAMPGSDAARPGLVDIVRRQAAGLKQNQAPDGMFRQVIDEPGSYREETATAMLLTALARGIRLGWLDRAYVPVVRRAWRALSAHVGDDGALVDVCSGTGGGPTQRYYLDRPAIDGFDDRGGAMALQAAMEMYDFDKMPPSGGTTRRRMK